jgi:hypothetical protein
MSYNIGKHNIFDEQNITTKYYKKVRYKHNIFTNKILQNVMR